MAPTALRIVTLNEIVRQYVRSDPLRGLLRSSSPVASAGTELGESEQREPGWSHMLG